MIVVVQPMADGGRNGSRHVQTLEHQLTDDYGDNRGELLLELEAII